MVVQSKLGFGTTLVKVVSRGYHDRRGDHPICLPHDYMSTHVINLCKATKPEIVNVSPLNVEVTLQPRVVNIRLAQG